MNALLAVGWEWELRGTLIVIMAVGVLCGSLFLILGTNLGARLGFLVALTGLAGWMFIMGAVWWTYGKGVLGPDPTWQPVASKTVIRDPAALYEVGIIDARFTPTDSPAADATEVQSILKDTWSQLNSALPSFAQAGASGSVFLEESGAYAAGEFQVVNVFEKGGERSPTFWNDRIDFIAFFHKPHYAVVEVAPLVPQREEPGRAPARAVIDTSRPHEYVYMIRDMGSKRVPSAIICISSLVIFLTLCWMLHTRDRRVALNRSAKALPAKV
ncbi:MAG TPA: hypothetical protein PK020_11155 [Ilumatobacteraceae bacterium]|nr:hypothetical protein [Ilumatobacteraceae bacterium]HRB04440.1 hypothetical protein [Ilumatobacteraceae bacterium]